ncbi:hypothetical protein ACOSQ2_026042 [Xanthoceras sorbifolium]
METKHCNFHNDVITEILSRLPVKSLMRFKCVCKCWNSLVKSPYFISKHFTDYNDDNTQLAWWDWRAERGRRVHLLNGKTVAELSQKEAPYFGNNIQVQGPFEGVFCLIDDSDSITLWNPAIREFRQLRKCSERSFNDQSYYFNIGFGLDIIWKDYKLVVIRSVEDYERFQHGYLDIWLYNLRFDFWTHIEIAKLHDYCLLKWKDSTYLSGVCYWVATRDRNRQKMCVVSFNLSDELFEEIQGPFSNQSSDKFFLGLYNNSLSLMLSDYKTTDICFDIWVMKEGFWTKQLTIGPLQGVIDILGFWKNGDILIKSDFINALRYLLSYNLNTQKICDSGIFMYSDVFRRYKESLVTIKQDDYGFDIPWYILGEL